MPPSPRSALDRFNEKVFVDPRTGCWEWTAAKHLGYGVFGISRSRMVGAHRWAYEFFVGPIPEGLEIDHLCRNRGCVNPMHLEPVTHRENIRRGDSIFGHQSRRTRCPRGHAYDEKNTYVARTGERHCRACGRERAAERRRRAA